MKILLLKMFVFLIAGTTIGEARNAWTEETPQTIFLLDSVITRNSQGVRVQKMKYRYDKKQRKISELGISYSEWTEPAYSPQYADSLCYVYDKTSGMLVKEEVYGYESRTLTQFVEYTYDEKTFLKEKEVTYRYNENVEDFIDITQTEYKYAEDGSLLDKVESYRPEGRPGDTQIYDMEKSFKTEYSDFVAKDLPRKLTSYAYVKATEETPESWMLNYYTDMEYDSNHQVIKSEDYRQSYTTGDMEISRRDEYVYEDGLLKEHTVANINYDKPGELLVDDKTHYEYDAERNLTKVTGEQYYSYNDSWAEKDARYYYYAKVVPSSVNGVEKPEVHIFYDCVSKEICISGPEAITVIRLYSSQGMLEFSGEGVATSNGRTTVKTNGLSSGMYIVVALAGHTSYNQKVCIYE